ncbi:MAG TPA: LysE family transporter [Spirochaetia bacterium]|nr:LysE family transporter [Spirochaetia bacterium]
MDIPWVALAGFVLVTTFTPGPNNISALSVGISAGYRKALRFLGGVTAGFFIVMCLCALVAGTILSAFPRLQVFLRIGGSLYIAWLAVHTFREGLRTESGAKPVLGFAGGFVLQILNAKVIIYGLTLYSAFLAPLAGQSVLLAASAVVFAAVGFCATSVWALAGSTFTRVLSNPLVRRVSSTVLALLLLYSAVESSGLLTLVSTPR